MQSGPWLRDARPGARTPASAPRCPAPGAHRRKPRLPDPRIESDGPLGVGEKELQLSAILHHQGQAVFSEKAYWLYHALDLFQARYCGVGILQIPRWDFILVDMQFVADCDLLTVI